MISSIATTSSVATPTRLAASNTSSEPKDCNDCGRFAPEAGSFRRDAFLMGLMGITLAAKEFVPGPYKMIVGGAAGLIGGLNGLGELHEGMKRGSTKEVLDGAAHLGAAVVTAGIGFSGPLVGTYLASVGVGGLLLKGIADHPKAAIGGFGKESWHFVRDGAAAVGFEFKRHHDATPPEQPKP
ncbi:MAG: hypothetical protein ACYCW6_01605 [Candidatus Xenobia bacterium]